MLAAKVLPWLTLRPSGAKSSMVSCSRFPCNMHQILISTEGLFSKTASDSQKFRGFLVFQKALASAADLGDAEMIKAVFSKHLLSCLMNQAAKKDRAVHLAATRCLDAIVQTAAIYPDAVYPMAKALLGKRGAFNFDQRSHSKTVEKVLETPVPKSGKKIFRINREGFLSTVA